MPMDLSDDDQSAAYDDPPWPTTAFGCVAPRAVRGVDVQLAYGERADGTIAHISEVASGLACGCICPGCKTRLVARKGAEKVHHFAHHGTLPCQHARESALHKLAKEVLDERRELLVPAVGAQRDGNSLVTHKERVHRFDGAVLEHRLDTIIPDVIVRKGKHRLLVEIFVTHRCDLEKIRRIEALGISCLEIDLRQLPRDAAREQIEQALVSSANRWWIYNSKLEEAAQQLDAQIAAKQEAARVEAAKQRLREEQRITALEKSVLAARDRPRGQRTSQAIASIVGMGFADLVGFSVAGDFCFQMSSEAWQAEIVDNFLVPVLEQGNGLGFESKAVLKHLKAANAFQAGFPTYFDPAAEKALQARIPEFRSPYKIIEAYLGHLSSNFILSHAGRHWSLGHNGRRMWSEYRERERRKSELLQSIQICVARLLRNVPEMEREGFDISVWMNRPHADLGISFDRAIAESTVQLSELNFRLHKLEAMVLRNGEVVDDLMGLPLAAERERIIERQQAEREAARLGEIERARKATEDRMRSLETTARQLLQAEAQAWLNTALHDLGNQTPLAAAEASAEGCDRALMRLTFDGRAKAVRIERERLHGRLLGLAAQAPKPDHARLFLNCPNPAWRNQRPIECCVDERSFEEVRRAMAIAAK
jgi:ribosomal protein L19